MVTLINPRCYSEMLMDNDNAIPLTHIKRIGPLTNGGTRFRVYGGRTWSHQARFDSAEQAQLAHDKVIRKIHQ